MCLLLQFNPILHWQKLPQYCTINKLRYFMSGNSLKKVRESLLMSKTELARKANVSPITIARIEKGMPCRMETQRKILLALGFNLSDKDKIFQD
jgi:DNA-binding XRE family transcriptional regulator